MHFIFTNTKMPPRDKLQRIQNEGRIALATSAYKTGYVISKGEASTKYNVPEFTMRTRLQGVLPRHETPSPLRNFIDIEE